MSEGIPIYPINQMPKKGKICGDSNYKAYEDFLVNPRWITGYLQRGKMHVADAKEELSLFV